MIEKYKLIFTTVIGIIILSMVIVTEIQIKNEKLVNIKTAFIVIALLGFIMCCIGKAVQINGWMNPIVIICILLGIIALLLIGVFLTGRLNINNKMAFRILYWIIIIKWALTTIHHMINFMK
ncbi:hypothetical protein Ccar_03975 [Clostridium carboxidivorans P7]|uniref:Uncharacterized protein n=1 Tax=Clostridium carboxidivorans P7 TaxID=536227 RepID=C6PRW5_9CLOT|nr:hypothetical protein [Clostridium carboxidivorans]AKN30027.1 hypothetical protein Ccar_03975 [Clostridium carboxidivorans P7]EET88017.1 hypothetical protein CcarbDRAFT_1532 [Clostridium carboxidivorans P7]EFG89027.1 hypothetical protein CLCAR_1209 [Clostridium carboxidivorans P7]